jgi:hypothetical protein
MAFLGVCLLRIFLSCISVSTCMYYVYICIMSIKICELCVRLHSTDDEPSVDFLYGCI